MKANLSFTTATPPPSTTPFAKNPLCGDDTLYAFCTLIENGAACSQREKQAILGFRRACRHDPALQTMRANGRVIVPRLKRLTRVAGLSKKSALNMTADARFLLELYHAQHPGVHHRTSLTGQWFETFSLLEGDRYLKISLSRFCHWCQDHGIGPVAVDDQALEQFEEHLRQVIGDEQPTAGARVAARHWNLAAETIKGWPQLHLQVPSGKVKPKSPSLVEMSIEMQSEIQTYLNFLGEQSAVNHDDQFEDIDEMTRPNYSPETIKGRLSVLRRAIGLLSSGRGIPVKNVQLSNLGDTENVRYILKAYKKDLGDNPAAPALTSMAYALLVLARDYLHVDQASIEKLTKFAKRAAGPARDARQRNGGLTPKNRQRLLQIGPKELAKLLLLPKQLIGKAYSRVKAGTANVHDFVDAQIGFAIASLLVAPTRGKNTAMTRLVHHLDLPEYTDGPAILKYDFNETKNRRSLEFTIPSDVANLMRLYVYQILPQFRGSQTVDFLYPGALNDSKGPGHLGTQITERVSKHVGIEINQHLFRHLLAVIYLRKNPGNYAVVQELLGHSSVETTRRYYCGLEGQAALAHFQEVMTSLRSDAMVGANETKRKQVRKAPSGKRR